MRDKLTQQVFMTKAYKRTRQTMKEKYEAIQKCLEADRDFSEIAGTGKSWSAFQSQSNTIMGTFKAKYALDGEGAYLSCLDPAAFERFSETERVLWDMAEEIENLDEASKERTEKEKRKNAACLIHEKSILETRFTEDGPPSGSKDSVASGLTDDIGSRGDTSSKGRSSVQSILDSFLSPSALLATQSPSKEELKLKVFINTIQ